ncbi:hypothetical protein [Bradyrhizobium pachyrhizi]|uniref:hypothetical protein n=1 Tax=Bradyrhizobium pachyrhizi TaxID=280333 RepID=UPI003D36DF40
MSISIRLFIETNGVALEKLTCPGAGGAKLRLLNSDGGDVVAKAVVGRSGHATRRVSRQHGNIFTGSGLATLAADVIVVALNAKGK